MNRSARAGFAATAIAAIGLMVIGAGRAQAGLTYAGGGLFLLTALAAGGGLWRAATGIGAEAAALGYARLIGASWLWSGAAMLATYYLTDLFWQHAWQYGAAFALIGAGILAYARARAEPGSRFAEPAWATPMRWITAVQGLAALIGVSALVYSGKVEAFGRDWAANIVFIAGGLSIFVLSAMAVSAERRR